METIVSYYTEMWWLNRYNIIETICSNFGGLGSDSKNNGSISRNMFLGKNNPSLPPDYQMACS